MGKMLKLILLSALALPLFACKILYDSGQDYQYQQCSEDAITPEQHRECEAIFDTSYKQYQKQRQTVTE